MKKSKQKNVSHRDNTNRKSTNHINLYDHTIRTLNIDPNITQVNLQRVRRSHLDLHKSKMGSVIYIYKV